MLLLGHSRKARFKFVNIISRFHSKYAHIPPLKKRFRIPCVDNKRILYDPEKQYKSVHTALYLWLTREFKVAVNATSRKCLKSLEIGISIDVKRGIDIENFVHKKNWYLICGSKWLVQKNEDCEGNWGRGGNRQYYIEVMKKSKCNGVKIKSVFNTQNIIPRQHTGRSYDQHILVVKFYAWVLITIY